MGRGKLKFEYDRTSIVGHDKHIKNFHCIEVFSGYTAFNALMATCVTVTDLTDWSQVNSSVKTAKFRSGEGRKAPFQKSSKISIYILIIIRLSKHSLGIVLQ